MTFSKTRLFLLAFAILFFFGGPAFGGSEIIRLDSKGCGRSDLYVLSIGINKYSTDPTFKFGVADAEETVATFQKKGQFIFDKVETTLLTDTSPVMPTRTNILQALDDISRKASSCDVFVFSFAGAGWSFDGEYYLYPSDHVRDSKDNEAVTKSTAISNAVMQTYFRKIRARSKVIIQDSGKFDPDAASLSDLTTDGNESRQSFLAENYLVIATDTASYELPELKHGSISYLILKGIEGDADFNGDLSVSSRELEAFMYKGSLDPKANPKLQFHPKTISKGDFKLALTDTGLTEAARINAIVQKRDAAQKKLSDFLEVNPNAVGFLETYNQRRQFATYLKLASIISPTLKMSGYEFTSMQRDLSDATIKSIEIDDGLQVDTKSVRDLSAKRIAEADANLAAVRTSAPTEIDKLLSLKKVVDDLNRQLAGEDKSPIPTRSDLVPEAGFGKKQRTGRDYALIFANWQYDQKDGAGWRKLDNPLNDANAIKSELISRYGFAEADVEIKPNFTADDISKTIADYSTRFSKTSQDDSQLFIYFAGHGYGEKTGERTLPSDGGEIKKEDIVRGFYVGKDSEYPFSRRTSGSYVDLDVLFGQIEGLPFRHLFVVFDACFAGVVWRPKVELRSARLENTLIRDNVAVGGQMFAIPQRASGPSVDLMPELLPFADGDPLAFMRRRSRVSLTSGDAPVPDAERKDDGTLTEHSPFAMAFLKALQSNGNINGISNDNILTTKEVDVFTQNPGNTRQRGTFGGEGDFVFIHTEPKKDTVPK